MKINITVSLFNRIDYSRQCLDHISNCVDANKYRIFVNIDKSPYQEELIEIVSEHSKKLDINCHICPKNLGCNKAIYECLDWSFEDADFNIHIEDDILLSKDALQYFDWCANKFIDDKSVFTIDGYNNKPYILDSNKEYELCKVQSFKPWGWCFWKDRWLEIKDKWQFGYGSKYEQGKRVFDGGGWDVCMKQYLRGDRCRVYPLLARSINIGAIGGVHTPSEEWHNKKHSVKFWANDLKLDGMGYYIL